MLVPRRTLRPPALPTPLFAFEAALARLAAGREAGAQVTLGWGPPGCGKSTVVARHARASGGPVAWVNLGVGDAAEAAELATLVVAALAGALPGFSDHPARLLAGEAVSERLLRHTAGLVAAELEALAPAGALLVLDGLDALAEAPTALAWLEQLVAFFPPEAQLVLLARARPALKLAPYRLAGSLVELGPALWWPPDGGPTAWTAARAWAVRAAGASAGGPVEASEGTRGPAMAGDGTGGSPGGAGEPVLRLDDATAVAPLAEFLRETWLERLPEARRLAIATLAAAPDLRAASLDAETQALLAPGDVLLARPDGAGGLHPVLRAALGAAAPPATDAAHDRAAALEAEAEADGRAPVDALAAYLAAGREADALRLLDVVAPDLVERNARERLARLLDAFTPGAQASPAWRLARGEHDRLAGDLAAAQAHFEAVAATPPGGHAGARPGAGAGAWIGRAQLGLATLAAMRGDEAAMALAEAALASFGPAAPRERAAAEGLLGVSALLRGDLASSREHLGRALAGFEAAQDRLGSARVLHNLALGHAYAGDHGAAIARYGEAAAALAEAGRVPFPLTPINRGLLRAIAGDMAGGREDAEHGLRLARERGARRDAAYGLWVLAKLRTMEGRWSLASGLFDEALAAGREAGDALVQADALAGLAEVALRRGLPTRAAELVAEAEALRGLPWHAPGLYELALVAAPTLATLGRREEAIQGLARLTAAMEAEGQSPHRRARALVAQASLLAHAPAEAEALRDRARALAALHGYADLTATLGEGRDAPPPAPAPAQAPELALRLFGKVEADVDGEPLAPARWRGPRIRLLLAFLFLERHGATRERLEAAFFGAADASRAAVPLMIKRVREALEPALAKSTLSRFVLFEDGRYLLNRARGVDADVDRFRQALELARATARQDAPRAVALYEEALGHYRGPLLAGFDEDWAVAAREGMRRQALGALTQLGHALVAADRAPDALRWAEAIARQDRTAEEPTLVRMHALAAMGRREEARKAVAELTTRLRRELGVAPSPEVEALLRQIMRGEWRPPALAGFTGP